MRTQRKSSAAALGTAFLALLGGSAAVAQVDGTNWGSVTAPVYGTSEGLRTDGTATITYSSAELLAGPNKSKELALPSGYMPTYFDGVLPNGKKVIPAGVVAQIGMHPLGSALTPDGQYIVISCDDERNITNGLSTLTSTTSTGGSLNLLGGYSVTVLRTSDMTVAAQTNVGLLFVGLQIVPSGGGYTIYASGGGDQNVKVLTFTPPTATAAGTLTSGTPIKINPITPNGSVTNFTKSASFTQGDFPENSGTSGGTVAAPLTILPVLDGVPGLVSLLGVDVLGNHVHLEIDPVAQQPRLAGRHVVGPRVPRVAPPLEHGHRTLEKVLSCPPSYS